MPWPWRWRCKWRRAYERELVKRLEAERQRDEAMDTLAEMKARIAVWERHTIIGQHLAGQAVRCPDCGRLRQPIGEHFCLPMKG